MSYYFMKHGEPEPVVYDDGMTKQSFKDETDVNKILGKYMKTGVISHLNKYEPMYGDFDGFDFVEAHNQLLKGQEIFDALPSELRREFDQSPEAFFAFVNDPENKDRLGEIFPELAKKGNYFPDVSGSTPPDALVGGGEPGPPITADLETATAPEEPSDE